jgi:uroporphyrinogen-III synthase
VSAAALRGLRVLVTRPAQQAAPLCELIRAVGGEALALPLQVIEAVDAGAPALGSAATAAALAIFTSANAVRCGLRLHAGPWPPLLAAAGGATAEALHAVGLGPALVPAGGDGIDGLLAEPALQDLRGQRVLVVTGADSRAELAPALRSRGAQVEVVEVYRRVALAVDGAVVAGLLESAQAAIVTSGEALQRLYEVTPPAARAQLLRLQLAVPSQRVAQQARALDFQRPPLVPARVSDGGFLAALQDWAGAR